MIVIYDMIHNEMNPMSQTERKKEKENDMYRRLNKRGCEAVKLPTEYSNYYR
jgi:hypothetical protein